MSKSLMGLHTTVLGCDPEVFLSRPMRGRKSIVGSEFIIPPIGIHVERNGMSGGVVRDGVQVELHPQAVHCRANLSYNIQTCFRELNKVVEIGRTKGLIDLAIDFSPVVKLSKGDLNRLSPDSRKLGCMPSKNAYGRTHIEKDGEKFLTRSAAGHIHVGSEMFSKKGVERKGFVCIMDVLVGNTAVLMDRHPLAAERRKLYGRAGEYRTPAHGVEYRTLSNFWLRHYVLMSAVFGLTKVAALVAQAHAAEVFYRTDRYWSKNMPGYWYTAEEDLMGQVDLRLIEQAINTNDFDLALSNFNAWVRPWLMQLGLGDGLYAGNLPAFDHFIGRIRADELAGKDPLGHWFPEDPLTHWLTKPDGHGNGWEAFLAGAVTRDMQATQRIPTMTGTVAYVGPTITTPFTGPMPITPATADNIPF